MYKQFLRVLGVSLALGGLAAGCGEGDEQQVKDAMGGWWADVAAGRGPQACQRLTETARTQFTAGMMLEPGDCELLVRAVAAELTPTQKKFLPRITIRRVEVQGDRALIHDRDARVPRELEQLADLDDQPTVLRRIDGRWLIEDMG